MFATKAVLALSMMAAGGATAGSVVYMQHHPGAFTHPGAPVAVAANAPSPVRPLALPSFVPDEPRVVMIPEVSIVARPPTVHRAVARPAEVAAPVPCSGWSDMQSGPAGRQVRMLCIPGSR